MAFHALTVSAEAIRKAGGPRADLFFGGPDVEFCLRLAHHGYALFYLPELRVTHHEANYRRFWLFGSRKVPAGTPGHRYYVLRNRLLMWRMYHRDGVMGGVATVIARELTGALLASDRLPRLRLLAQAIRDAAIGDPKRKMVNAVPLR
jgi:rhamnosyltransferase